MASKPKAGPHTPESVEGLLARHGFAVVARKAIAHGLQLRCAGGQVVNVYATGRALAQGHGAAEVSAILCGTKAPARIAPRAAAKASPQGGEAAIGPNGGYVTTPAMIGRILAALPADAEPLPDRRPADWSDEPWDGVSAPF